MSNLIPRFVPQFTGGVRVAVADVNGDGVLAGGAILAKFDSFFAYDPSFRGGLFVAAK